MRKLYHSHNISFKVRAIGNRALFVIILLLSLNFHVMAQVAYSVAAGNWNTASNWSPPSIPSTTADLVVVRHNMTVNTSANINELSFTNGVTLTISNNRSLTTNNKKISGDGSISVGNNTLLHAGIIDIDDLTFTSGAEFTAANVSATNLDLGDADATVSNINCTNNLSIDAATLEAIDINATNDITITGNATLNVNDVSADNNFTISGDVILTANDIDVGALANFTGQIDFNVNNITGASYTITDDNSTLITGDFSISDLTVPADAQFTVNNFTVSNSFSLTGGSGSDAPSIYCYGNWDANTPAPENLSVVIKNAGSTQGISNTGSFYDLELNNSNDFTLNSGVNVVNTFNLLKGVVTLGVYNLNIYDNSVFSVTSPSNSTMIDASGTGGLSVRFTGATDFTYPIGDASNYTPLRTNFTALSGDDYVKVNVVESSQLPDDNSTSNYLNRYWALDVGASITSHTVSMDATYVGADLIDPADGIDVYGAHKVDNSNVQRFSTLAAGGGTFSVTGISNASYVGGVSGKAPELTSVTVISDNSNDSKWAKENDVITISMVFDEVLKAAPLIEHEAAPIATSGSDKNWTATYTVTAGTTEGLFTFTIDQDYFEGIRGNLNIAQYSETTTSGSNVTVDHTSPVVTPVTIYSNNSNDTELAIENDQVYVDFQVNEGLSSRTAYFKSGGVDINGVVGISPAAAGAGEQYTASYTVQAGDANGSVTFTIDCEDFAGNTTQVTSVTDASQVTVDKTLLSPNPIWIESNNANSQYLAKEGDLITLHFSLQETPATEPVVTLAGSTTTISNIGLDYIAQRIVTTANTEGAVSFDFDIDDLAGNTITNINSLTAGQNVVIDYTAPTINPMAASYIVTPPTAYGIGDKVKTIISTNDVDCTPNNIEINNISYPDNQLTFISEAANSVYTLEYTVQAIDKQLDNEQLSVSVSVTDEAGNISNTELITENNITIVPDLPTAVVSKKTTLCAGEDVSFSAFGGKGPYELYFQRTSPSLSSESMVSVPITNEVSLSGVTETGTYELTRVIDDNNIESDKMGTPFQFTIRPLPEVTYILDDKAFSTSESVELDVPANATIDPPFDAVRSEFSGTGVIGGTQNYFLADQAGEGKHTIRYTYTDNFGCTNFAEEQVTVTFSEVYLTDFDNSYKHYCRDGTPDAITGVSNITFGQIYNLTSPTVGLRAGTDYIPGKFSVWDTINGNQLLVLNSLVESTDGNFTGVSFDPSAVPTTRDTFYIRFSSIEFSYNFPSIGNDAEGLHFDYWEQVIVETIAQPGYASSADISCQTPGTFKYIASNPDKYKGSGSFSVSSMGTNQTIGSSANAPFIGFRTDDGSNELEVNPEVFTNISGEYRTYTISYTFTSTKGNCSSIPADDAYTVGIIPSPDIQNIEDGISIFSRTGPDITLIGDPTNSKPGTNFSGSGVSGNTFSPSSFAANATPEIEYEYESSVGCSNSTIETVEVVDSKGQITGINDIYCYSNTSVQFLYDVDLSSNPNIININIYSDNGAVTQLPGDGRTAVFDIAAAGDGYDMIHVEYEELGSFFTLEKQVLVDSIGQVDFNINPNYCANDSTITLYGIFKHPNGGGNFSGPSSGFINLGNIATLNPQSVSPGTYPISYEYISTRDNSGCTAQVSKQTKISAVPNVSILDLNSTYNVNGEPVELNGNYTPNGEFTGQGVSFGKLYPSSIGVKSGHPITYSYTDNSTGCSNSVTEYIDIIDASGKITNLNDVYCYSDTTITVNYVPDNGQNISGEFYSKNNAFINLNGNSAIYSISKAGYGSDTVTFTYIQDNVTFKLIKTVFIDSIGEVDFIIDEKYCADDPLTTISARFSHPEGDGKFSQPATGFVNLGNQLTLEPAKITPRDIPYDITYTYTSKLRNSGCFATAEKPVYIYPVPSLDFSINDNYNVEDDPVILSANPKGGIFTGPGVVDTTFYPAIAGKGYDYQIKYTYIDSLSGCSNSMSRLTNVLKADAEILGIDANNTYCYDGKIDTLTGVSVNGIPGGSLAGAGIQNIGNDKALFSPSAAGEGEHTVTYTYTSDDGLTEFVVFETIFVDSVEEVSISGLDEAYCVNDKEVQIFGSKGSEGAISGPGVISTGGSGWFYPTLAGTQNSPHTISFIYTAESGCKSFASQQVNILALPQINFEIRDIFNIEEDPEVLIGIPTGGKFSGRGIIQQDNSFAPQIAGIGRDIDISYTYTDSNSCTNITTKQTNVESADGHISGINLGNIYCYYEDADTLTGVSKNGLPNGYFQGKGITNIGNDKALFVPRLAGRGEHEINYLYKAPNDTTTFSISVPLIVDSVGQVSFIGLDQEYCYDNKQVQLTALAPPDGRGDFSGLDSGFINAGNSAWIYPSEMYPSSNEFKKLTYTFTSNLGCVSTATDSFIVHPLPEIDFIIDSAFCANDAPVLFTGIPTGGQFTGPNVDNLQNQARFSPDPLILGDKNLITYFYTDSATGCSNEISKYITVNRIASLSLYNLDKDYCENDSSGIIQGLVDGNTGLGTFSGTGVDTFLSEDGKAVFNPWIAPVGQHNLNYRYQDENGCIAEIDTTINVFDQPSINLGGLKQNRKYCKTTDEPTIILDGIHPGTGGVSNFFINNESIQSGVFDPVDYLGLVPIIYEYTNNNGCKNVHNDSIMVYEIPEIDFAVENFCLPDTIRFKNLASDSNIVNWSWEFGDNSSQTDTSFSGIINHRYSNTGSQLVLLEVETKDGCEADTSKRIFLSKYPSIQFDWDNECLNGSPVSFQATSNLDMKNWNWDFGDGNTSTEQNPFHKYNNTGTFSITLIAEEIENSCSDTLIRQIPIRSFIKFLELDNSLYQDYTENFETETGWVKQINESMPYSSWNLGQPNGGIISEAASGVNAWYTQLDTLAQFEQSAILSPCFDFSSLKRPMIKLNYWASPNSDRDGAVLQYKVDDNWNNLGTVNSGISWYNTSGIFGNPGNQELKQEGWSKDNTGGWKEARHKLDNLAGKDKVIFRIAYGSPGGSSDIEYDGFAFDDIWIGERTKNVLIEHFTNSSSNDTKKATNELNNLVESQPGIINIQYHTSFPGDDPMNKHNVQDPSARALYYGVNTVPSTVLDGSNDHTRATENLDKNEIEKRILLDAPFEIELITESNDNSISLTASITSTDNKENISVYVAVIEKEINAITGTNGQTSFKNVLKKMLPDAGGTQFQNWTAGETKTLNLSWSFENVYNTDNIHIIVFVQNEVDKEIYQAVTSDTAQVSTGIHLFSTLGKNNIVLYPVPAKTEINLLCSIPLNESYNIEILNSVGQIIFRDKFLMGEIQKEIQISHLHYGMYFIRLIPQNRSRRNVKTLKFIKINK